MAQRKPVAAASGIHQRSIKVQEGGETRLSKFKHCTSSLDQSFICMEVSVRLKVV